MSHGFCGPYTFLMSPGFDKAALRAASLDHRARVAPAVATSFAHRLGRLGPELARAHGAQTVSAFWSIGDEVSTEPLLRALDEAGFPVGLPITGKRGMPLVFRRWARETPLVPGRMNIPEPPAAAEIITPDVLFVPLAAFDRRGHRIGYGAGFYDATLATLRSKRDVVAIGVAFASQEVLFVPAEDHDQALDFVVTEKDIIVCADSA